MMQTNGTKTSVTAIGPSVWRNSTLRELEKSQTAIRVCNDALQQNRATDPPPIMRETFAELSNEEAHEYSRQVRVVVLWLREAIISINEEIKRASKMKGAMEKRIFDLQGDTILNEQSQKLRSSRPDREKERDGADDMLHAEGKHLRNMKNVSKRLLQTSIRNLQNLSLARKKLLAVLQERTRVLDLAPQSLPNSAATSRVSSANPRFRSRSAVGFSSGSASGIRREDKIQPFDPLAPNIDPLGAYTPEADRALKESKVAIEQSVALRNNMQNSINSMDRARQAVHASVNSGLINKMAETESLRQQLDMAAAEVDHTINKARKAYGTTETSWLYSQGPMTHDYVTTRERLDRPLIKVFQRHPGTNLPEAQEIIKTTDSLQDSLHTTRNHIGLLAVSSLKLKEDMRIKKQGLDVDNAIIHMRRRHSSAGQYRTAV